MITFIGVKLLIEDLYVIGTFASLGLVALAFAVGMVASLLADRRDPEPAPEVAQRRPPRGPPSIGSDAAGARRAAVQSQRRREPRVRPVRTGNVIRKHVPMIVTAALAAVLLGCGESQDATERASVASAKREGLELDKKVTLAGRANPLGSLAFVLSEEGESVWVMAPDERVKAIRPGQTLEISGTLKRLTTDQTNQLATAAADTDIGQQPGGADALDAQRYTGSLYLDARGPRERNDAPED